MDIKMSDIAKLAGVSKSTVSRALKNDSRVKEETKNKILKIAGRYNYQPNKVAQALAEKNTKIIAVILPSAPRSVSDPFFLEFLHGVNNKAYQQGYSLTMPPVKNGKFNSFKEINQKLNVDGVILTEPLYNDPRIKYLKENKIPFVFNGNPMTADDTAWVDTDNQLGAYQAVNYLIKNGHQKIATITGPLDLVAGRSRLEGYYRALRENKIKINKNWILEADFTEKGSYLKAKNLIKEHPEITAVFAANDLMALGVIRALKEAGIKIPADLSLTAFDSIKLGEYIEPALTTVKNNGLEKGEKAVELLIKIIENQDLKKKQILFTPELIIRDSVKAVF
ncbi:MAG: LacI family DNA-binding transcriptional regulator [Halanaerobium sp.]